MVGVENPNDEHKYTHHWQFCQKEFLPFTAPVFYDICNVTYYINLLDTHFKQVIKLLLKIT